MSGRVGWYRWMRVGGSILKWEVVWICFSFSRGVDVAISERKSYFRQQGAYLWERPFTSLVA
jgi:hypothetical protein